MKNKIIAICVSFLAILTFQSCLDDTVKDFGQGPIVAQFPSMTASQNFLQDGSGEMIDYKVPIQYYGGTNDPLAEPVTVTVGVSSSSVAKEGVHFEIPNKEVVIPAGSNVGELTIQVNPEALDADNPPVLKLEIVDASVSVSSNKNVMNITLQAVCPSALEGTYAYYRANGTIMKQVTVTSTGTGTYSVSADNAFASPYPFDISDVCGKITVTGGYLEDNFGIPVSGSGYVDEATGNIVLSYTAEGYFENRTMILVKQ